MTREEAILWLKVINTKEFGWDEFALQESQREIRERCEQGVREAIDMAIEALSERNIAREIATILENEQDMRVVLQNDAIQADDRIEQNKIYCSPLVAENVEVVVRCKDCRWQHTSRKSGRQICAHHNGLIYAADDNFCSHGERSEPSK